MGLPKRATILQRLQTVRAPNACSSFSKFVSSVFPTVVFTCTRMHTVAYRLSSWVPCILGRFSRTIGIVNLRGSMRPRRKRREKIWRRASFTVAVYRTAFLFSDSIPAVTMGAATGIAICAGSTLGPILLSSHPPVDLTNPCTVILLSPPISIKLSVLLACRVRASPFELLFTPLHLTSFRPGVHFHCDVNLDPFVYMHESNKLYCS
jgi:hypothetical protein